MLILGTGSSPPSYHAGAVHTDGTAWLSRASALIGLTDSYYGVLSIWTNINSLEIGQTDIFCSQPANNLDLFNADHNSDGIIFLMGSAPDTVLGAAYHNPFNGQWNHSLIAWNTDFASGSRLLAVYVSGVQQTPGHSTLVIGTDDGNAFMTAIAEETAWGVMGGGSGDVVAGDYADLQFYQGLNIVQSDGSLLSNDIANFINGGSKPVNPAVAAAAYGTPTLLFSGNATGFPTNQGSGGAFIVNGTLSNANTSPSD